MDFENRYGTLEMQKKLLELLKEFHRFCTDNGISYSLDWGSLLGAVRHKGFIPWDDDLDVMVDRDNYEKIQTSIGGNLVYEHGTIDPIWVDKIRLEKYSCETIKPTLDVFIIDNAPNGYISRKTKVMMIRFLQGMLKSNPNFKKGKFLYRVATLITFIIGRCFSRKMVLGWYNWLSQLSNKKQTEKKACYNDNFFDIQKLYHNDILLAFIEVPFEDTMVYITKEFHNALVDKFGSDYMQLPSESERVPKRL